MQVSSAFPSVTATAAGTPRVAQTRQTIRIASQDVNVIFLGNLAAQPASNRVLKGE